MTRPRQRTNGPAAVNPERKAIEDRAREASKPAGVEKKGRWPFTAASSAEDDAFKAAKTEKDHSPFPRDELQ